jgi:hypothetical protein
LGDFAVPSEPCHHPTDIVAPMTTPSSVYGIQLLAALNWPMPWFPSPLSLVSVEPLWSAPVHLQSIHQKVLRNG